MKKKLFPFVFIFVFFVISFTAYAGPPSYTVRTSDNHGQLKYKVGPGSVMETEIIVKNLDETRSINVVFEKWKKTNAGDGDGEKFLPQEWYIFTPESLDDIAPGTQKSFKLKITIPPGAEKYSYVTGFVTKLADYSDSFEDQGAAVKFSVAVGMKIKVEVDPDFVISASGVGEPLPPEIVYMYANDAYQGNWFERHVSFLDLLFLLLIVLLLVKIQIIQKRCPHN